MIKKFTFLLLLSTSLNVLAEDVIITSDVPQDPNNTPASNGPVVNLGSPPQDTFFSFGNSASAKQNNTTGLSPFTAGVMSNLFSYETALTSSNGSNANLILNAGIETVLPNGFSYHGGFNFLVKGNLETALSIGGRFYSHIPIFGSDTPIYSYIGAGMLPVDGSTFYPEIGIRISPSDVIRMDLFFKAYTSSDSDYDKKATLGLGLSF
ncbi:hypothetical protein CBF23_013915 [Marinomonas agarivorans]|nr:hypothetical protein CBF23_013915 [Marinomonas agarivorans]